MHLGIDLGTSNSAIAGIDGPNIRIFKTAEGDDVLPSAVYIGKRGGQFVGERAYNYSKISPQDVAQGFKRLMGTSSPVAFASASVEKSPEECSAEIVKTLLGQAYTEAGAFEPEGSVVTVPAAFNQMQNEATLRSAQAAGLERVGLLQEPIAAAMASMANSKSKSGQFLIYDMGGGTFDAAIVQSVGGEVNVVAHAGVNMLGGRDFDRKLVNEFVHPWLLENFSLPTNFHTTEPYKNLLRIARFYAERAKIDLSAVKTAFIFADEEELRIKDEDGADIHLDIAVTRQDLERLIEEEIARSIDECRKVLEDNSYTHDDIDRIVLIGGPSKMPCVRERVPTELGIPADLQTDAMTAAAIGAAVFAESRVWEGGATKGKSTRAAVRARGRIKVEYVYRERVSDDKTRIRARLTDGSNADGYRVRIDAEDGWTSGAAALEDGLRIEVPLPSNGENRFRITTLDPTGAAVADASSDIAIFRTFASAAGVPAAQNISVKVMEGGSGSELDILIEKGTQLPASGSKTFRSAKNLRGGAEDTLYIELYQQEDADVSDPALNLCIGRFELNGKTDLEEGDYLRKGEGVIIDWRIDDNGILNCSVNIPSLSRELPIRKFYSPAAGHKNYEGDDGEKLVESALGRAERDIETLKRSVGNRAGAQIQGMERQLERQREDLSKLPDADARRSAAESAMKIRQSAHKVRRKYENPSEALLREKRQAHDLFEQLDTSQLDSATIERFQRLGKAFFQAIEDNNIADAERALDEMKGVVRSALFEDFGYLRSAFHAMREDRHLAVDKSLHDRLVQEGDQSLASKDKDGLRRAIIGLVQNRFRMGDGRAEIEELADLMR